jgi:crotonobetainyl-CoA:carnitine CoA-transferase CaiB-like acyl-CoA transferase
VAVDLKTPAGVAVIRGLVAVSDVVLENFIPG